MTPTITAEIAGQKLRSAHTRADFLPRQKIKSSFGKTESQAGGADGLPKTPSPDFTPRQEFSVEGRAVEAEAEIEIIAPDFLPRQKMGKGRPPSPVKFVIRPFDGGFGVWLVQSGQRRKYCCHLDGAEVNKTRSFDFASFGAYVLGRIRARQRTTQSAAKIDALLTLIPELIEQSKRAVE